MKTPIMYQGGRIEELKKASILGEYPRGYYLEIWHTPKGGAPVRLHRWLSRHEKALAEAENRVPEC